MREFSYLFLVIVFPTLSLLLIVALINPNWFTRTRLTQNRKYLLLGYGWLVLAMYLLMLFATAGGMVYLIPALVAVFFGIRAWGRK